jgi:hypothetical protein
MSKLLKKLPLLKLTGDPETLLLLDLLKTKDNVDHVGLSQLSEPLKDSLP